MPACLRGITAASKHIDSIVSGLRSFARAEENPLMLVIDPNLVVKAAATLTANLLRKSSHKFVLTLGERLPHVRGNFSHLEQVIINLIQNACDALTSPKEAITISTAFDPDTRRVRLSVRDEGIGMSADVLARISQPFFTTKRERGGLGLGLSISRSIVAAHGGELTFDSKPGRGTVASVILPAAALEDGGGMT
jgi:signal transduction histidine kinase